MYHELPGPHGESAKVPALTHCSSHNPFRDKGLRDLNRCISRQAMDCVRSQGPRCPVLGRAHRDATVHAPRPQELWCEISFSNDCSRTVSIKSTTVISVDLTPERHILATGSDDSQAQIDEPPLLATGSGDWQARICGPFYSLPLMGTNHRYCRELHQYRGSPSKTHHYQECSSNTQGCPSNTPAFFRRLTSSSSRVSLVYRWGFCLIFMLFHVT